MKLFKNVIDHERVPMFKDLIKKGVILPVEKMYFLWNAVAKESSGYIRFLLNNGADINVQNDYGFTTLHVAVSQNKYGSSTSFEDLKTLLSNNALLLNNIEKNTPLDVAIHDRNQAAINIITEIIDYKNNVAERDFKGSLYLAMFEHPSAFSIKEWIFFALHNKHHKQLRYLIDKVTVEPENILALILLNKQLPVDMANTLLSNIKNNKEQVF